MKKINAIAWLIAMLMTLVTNPIFATDWGSENVTMQVGEIKTLYLPSTVMTKTLKSVTFYSASWNDVEVISYTDYSVRVKALKATSTPVIVRCDYYYYINNGGYMYQNGGAYDFKITVEGDIKPINISISSTSSVRVGESFYFVPTVTPAKATYKPTWESSNSSIASVNQSGMLTGISAGTANITVTTDNGKSDTCKVTVNAPNPVEYEVNCHIYDNGKVIYNGTVLTGNESFNVAEGSDVSFTIIPDEGYKLDWLWIDYEDVKDQLVNNVLTIRNIRKDMYLVVSFEKSNIQPEEPVVTTENNFTLGNVTANTGTVVKFPVDMTNKDGITAFQMDLHLPSGISLATDADGDVKIETSSRVSNKHTIDCSKMPDGSYRVICYSAKNNTFTGNSGNLFNLMLNIDANAEDGDYVISATNIELSDITGTAYAGKDVDGIVTVKSYILGDVNGDGVVNGTDIQEIINIIVNEK